jgi:eukaryotic-like serine/threonine-protein kinase
MPRHHPFTWIVTGLATWLAVVFVGGAVILLRHGPDAGRLGWSYEARGDAVVVKSVDSTGAAASRLLPGDRILALDGDRRVSVLSLGWLLQPVPPGGTYTLDVVRDGSPRRVALSIAPAVRQGWVGTAVVRLFVAVVLVASGLVVGLLRPRHRLGRLYTLTVLLAAPVFFANPLLLQVLDTGVLSVPEALIVWLARLQSPFHGAVGFHFALEFPTRAARGRFWSALKVLFYAWTALICVYYNAAYFCTIFRPSLGVALTYGHPDLWRALMRIDSLYGPAIFAAMPAAIIFNAAFQTSPDQRRRSRWALFGALVGFLPLLALFTVRFIDQTIRPEARLLSGPARLYYENVALLLLAVAPLTLAYAVVKHRVFGIQVAVRLGFQHLLARNVLRAALLLPVGALAVSVLWNPNRTLAQIFLQHPVHLALIAASGASLRYRRPLQCWIDRRFFREAYDQEQVLHALVEDIRTRDSLSDLSRLVSGRLTAALHPERVYLVYHSLDGRDFGVEYSSGGDSAGLLIPEDAELIRRMEGQTTAQDVASSSGEGGPDTDWLRGLEVRLVVPMRASEGRLVGLLLLGGKKSEEPYSPQDRRLLEAVATQIALLYENAALRRRVEREEKTRRDVLSRLARHVNLVKQCPRCGRCYDQAEDMCPHDRALLTFSLPVERLLAGKYRLERCIGTGGMGTVFEATDLRLGRQVAVKILTARSFGDGKALRRFEREAQAAARLRHPRIVTIHDYGTVDPEGAFLVMELLQGTTLRQEMERQGAIAPVVAAGWFDQVLEAIQAAHAAGVIHRDLKPDNVFVAEDEDGDGAVKILDFGVAKLLYGDSADPHTLTLPGAVLGTLSYMSPEQLTGGPIDARADLFSIGILVAEALTGRHPFPRASPTAVVTAILHDSFHLDGEGRDVRSLESVLQRCLAKRPDDRYRTAADARSELIPAIRRCPAFPARTRIAWTLDTADSLGTKGTAEM